MVFELRWIWLIMVGYVLGVDVFEAFGLWRLFVLVCCWLLFVGSCV